MKCTPETGPVGVVIPFQTNTLGNGQFQMSASINGSRGNATNCLLDNADNNDGFTNIAEAYPNPDAVQEFSIQM